MFELLTLFGLLFLVGAFVVFVAKLLFSLVLLPIKLGFWLLKGVVALIFLVPIIVISLSAASVVVPVVLALVALPVLLVVGAAVLLAKLFA
ncbi:MAG: hypothetical protein P8181_13575 [bacterium]